MNAHHILRTALLVSPLFCLPQHGVAQANSVPADIKWHTDSAVYVAGLDNVKPNSHGQLRIAPESLVFSSGDVRGEILLTRITAVSIGEERVSTGGKATSIARFTPYGAGSVVGAVSNKSVDVLTVEYRDNTGAYHGAVFEIPKTQAALAQHELAPSTKPSDATEAAACSTPTHANSLLVAPIAVSGVDLPAEYRVLLYEQLVAQLTNSHAAEEIYRAGGVSSGPGCAATTLRLSVSGFTKGKERLRASTGPLGLFIGPSTITFHVDLIDTNQKVLFEQSLKKSKHGTKDDLTIADDLAKDISKKLVKSRPAAKAAGA